MVVVLHGNLRRLGERVEVEARTPREALMALGVDPEAEEWILAVGERVVGLDEPVEGPLEVYPPIAGGWYT
jgi:predicted phage tail protein